MTSPWDGKLYADGDYIVHRDGSRLGPFSSHWAACAALIRIYDPTFKSLAGDRPSDLLIEAARAALAHTSHQSNTLTGE